MHGENHLAARSESDIFSIFNVIECTVDRLVTIQSEIDNAGFFMVAIYLDQAIECLRKEQKALNLLLKTP